MIDAVRRCGRDGDDLAGLVARCVSPIHNLTERELAQRRRASLTPQQDAVLLRWGYPNVGEAFRFHLTLSGNLHDLPAARGHSLHVVAQVAFCVLLQPLELDALSLFIEPQPGGDFLRLARYTLGG